MNNVERREKFKKMALMDKNNYSLEVIGEVFFDFITNHIH
jgi:hypothetical protein